MTLVVLASFGACLSACLLHLTLGLRRPIQWREVLFGLMMVVVCAYLVADLKLYAVGTVARLGVVQLVTALAIGSFALWTSVTTAIDFRRRELELAKTVVALEQLTLRLERMLEISVEVRDKLNTPLQTLAVGLPLYAARVPEQRQRITSLRRAVAELAELGRLLQLSHEGETGPRS